MNRFGIVILVLFALVGAMAVAWFATSEMPSREGDPNSTVSETGEVDESPESGSEEGERARVRRSEAEVAETSTESGLAVGGTVYAGAKGPLGGVLVEAFAVPAGDSGSLAEQMRRQILSQMGEPVQDALEQIASDAESESGVIDASDLDMGSLMENGMDSGMQMLEESGSMTAMFDMVRTAAAEGIQDAPLPLAGTTRTASDGSFRIGGLDPGRVELRIRSEGFVRNKRRVEAGSEDLTVTLVEGVELLGVVTSNGEPLAGALIQTTVGETETGPDGRFAGLFVRPGQAVLLASAPGHVAGVKNVTVSLTSNEDIQIALDPAGSVTGIVKSATGSVVVGAKVVMESGLGGNPMAFMEFMNPSRLLAPVPSAVTDASGRFSMDTVPAGARKFRGLAHGYVEGKSEDVQVLAGDLVEGVEIVLEVGAAIVGRVTDSSGKPVAGARVRVEMPAPDGMEAMISQMFGGTWKSARTEEDGTYRVGEAPAGERKVRVRAEGYLTQEVTVSFAEGRITTHDVVIEPGHKVAGVVQAPDGSVVATATVRVKWKSGSANPFAAFMPGSSKRDTLSTKTDETGHWEATGLQPGPYDVTATARGFVDGQVTGVEQGQSEVVVALQAAATFRGRVVSAETGVGVGGASVFYKGGRPKPGANPFMAMMQGDPKVTTGADGAFEITGIEGGDYTLYSRRKSYSDSEKLPYTCAAGAVVDGIEIALPAGQVLVGRVVRASDGSPVAGATVFVPRDSNPFSGFVASDMMGEGAPSAPTNSVSTTSAVSGEFSLDGLSSGRLTVHVRATGLSATKVTGVEVPGAEIVVEMFVGGTVEGVVLDKAGRPQSQTRIMTQQGMTGQRMATTDSAGKYRIANLTPGTYTIMKLGGAGGGLMPEMKSVLVKEGEVTQFDFAPDKQASGRTLGGNVSRGGKPLSGATVILSGGGAFQMKQTGKDGTFSFDDMEPGDYTVTVQRGMMGGGTTTQTVTVGPDGQVENLELVISELKVEGSVVDMATGKTIMQAHVVLLRNAAGAQTSLENIMQQQAGQAFSVEDGTWEIDGVEEATYTLRVTAAGYPQMRVDGVTPRGGAVEVRMEKGLVLKVKVVDTQGRPVSGGNVLAEDANGRETSVFDMTLNGMTDADGVANLQLLRGRYTLHAQGPGLPEASVEVDASAGQITITLPSGASLSVTVTDVNGAPVSGVALKYFDAAGTELTRRLTMTSFMSNGAVTDLAGKATREGLPYGEVRVVATSQDGKTAEGRAKVSGEGGELTIRLD